MGAASGGQAYTRIMALPAWLGFKPTLGLEPAGYVLKCTWTPTPHPARMKAHRLPQAGLCEEPGSVRLLGTGREMCTTLGDMGLGRAEQAATLLSGTFCSPLLSALCRSGVILWQEPQKHQAGADLGFEALESRCRILLPHVSKRPWIVSTTRLAFVPFCSHREPGGLGLRDTG